MKINAVAIAHRFVLEAQGAVTQGLDVQVRDVFVHDVLNAWFCVQQMAYLDGFRETV
jgi:hypothetical protein